MAWLPAIATNALLAFAVPLSFVIPFALFGPMDWYGFTIAAAIGLACIQLPLAWACCRFVPLVARDG